MAACRFFPLTRNCPSCTAPSRFGKKVWETKWLTQSEGLLLNCSSEDLSMDFWTLECLVDNLGNVCDVVLWLFSIVEDIIRTVEGYHQYYGGILSVNWMVSITMGGYHQLTGGYSILWWMYSVLLWISSVHWRVFGTAEGIQSWGKPSVLWEYHQYIGGG